MRSRGKISTPYRAVQVIEAVLQRIAVELRHDDADDDQSDPPAAQ